MNRLNVGCGDDVLHGWDNCDKYPVNDSVIDTDILTLRGVKTNHYDEVRMHMVLEHVHVDLISTALHQASRVLKVGGVVTVTVPDMDYFFDLYRTHAKGKLDTTAGVMAFKEVCYQILDPELDSELTTHQCLFNFDFLRLMFLQEGFVDIQRIDSQPGTLVVEALTANNISTLAED